MEMTGTKRRRYPQDPPAQNEGTISSSATTASVGSDSGTVKAKKRFVWPDDLHR